MQREQRHAFCHVCNNLLYLCLLVRHIRPQQANAAINTICHPMCCLFLQTRSHLSNRARDCSRTSSLPEFSAISLSTNFHQSPLCWLLRSPHPTPWTVAHITGVGGVGGGRGELADLIRSFLVWNTEESTQNMARSLTGRKHTQIHVYFQRFGQFLCKWTDTDTYLDTITRSCE